MSLSSTLYTLAAIGFFALMVNRPAIEQAATPRPTDTNTTETSQTNTVPTHESSTAISNPPSTQPSITANQPPQSSDTSTSPQTTGTYSY